MKKVISLLLSVAMVLSLTAVEVVADDVETVTDDTEIVADNVKVMTVDTEDAEEEENVGMLDLSHGSIVISATGYSQNGGAETAFTGDYTIKQTDQTYIDKTISVTGGSHKITMSGAVDIDVHNVSDACAFSVASGASVELVLAGPVTLKSGSSRAGLSVPTGAAVTISATDRFGALSSEGGSSGAGIGGSNTTGGNITILSGTVEATGGKWAAGIGGGYDTGTGTNEAIHISGGKVTAIGGSGAAGIGGGKPYASSGSKYDSRSYGTGVDGKLTINGNANVTAISTRASGIGGGAYLLNSNTTASSDLSYTTATNGVISISGNVVVNATGALYGIGAYDSSDNNGALNISGGTVMAKATQETNSYGIGRIKRFTVNGGTVSASGYTGIYSAAVNSGVVTAESLKAANGFGTLTSNGNRDGWVISKPAQSSNNMNSGVLFSGSEGTVIGDYYELPADREIPDGATLTVNAGQELIIPAGTTLTVNGKLVVAGTLNTAETDAIAGSGETEITGTVTGKKLPIAIQAQNMSTMEKTFDVSTLFTIPQTAGAAAYTVTKDGTPVTLDGTTLSFPDGGVFTVTVATAETEF